jgi:hypothetical protein
MIGHLGYDKHDPAGRGSSWRKTRMTGPHSARMSSEVWRWDTRAGPTPWPFISPRSRRREGEGKEAPPQLKAQMEELNQLNVGEPEFFDLRHPWLYSP